MMLYACRPSCHLGKYAASAVAASRNSALFSSTTANGSGSDRSKEDRRAAEGQPDATGLTPGAFGGETAGSDDVRGPGPHKDLGQAEGGTSGGVAAAWRGMTSSFSVGADDMAGGSSAGTVEEDIAMKVNPNAAAADDAVSDGPLPPGPSETTGPAAEARAGGFGQQRDPQAAEGKEAPADLAQKARTEASSSSSSSSPQAAGAQEDATASGPKRG